jgi:hypothetical protein
MKKGGFGTRPYGLYQGGGGCPHGVNGWWVTNPPYGFKSRGKGGYMHKQKRAGSIPTPTIIKDFLALRVAASVAFAAAFFVDEGGFSAFGAEIANLHHMLCGGNFYPRLLAVPWLF